MNDRKQILLSIVASRVVAEGLPIDASLFVDECRPLARQILDRDESPVLVSEELPQATPETPWEGYGWVSNKWVQVWFDGTIWRRNSVSGNDISGSVTYWRSLRPP